MQYTVYVTPYRSVRLGDKLGAEYHLRAYDPAVTPPRVDARGQALHPVIRARTEPAVDPVTLARVVFSPEGPNAPQRPPWMVQVADAVDGRYASLAEVADAVLAYVLAPHTVAHFTALANRDRLPAYVPVYPWAAHPGARLPEVPQPGEPGRSQWITPGLGALWPAPGEPGRDRARGLAAA